jgi:hypothetical protein
LSVVGLEQAALVCDECPLLLGKQVFNRKRRTGTTGQLLPFAAAEGDKVLVTSA